MTKAGTGTDQLTHMQEEEQHKPVPKCRVRLRAQGNPTPGAAQQNEAAVLHTDGLLPHGQSPSAPIPTRLLTAQNTPYTQDSPRSVHFYSIKLPAASEETLLPQDSTPMSLLWNITLTRQRYVTFV